MSSRKSKLYRKPVTEAPRSPWSPPLPRPRPPSPPSPPSSPFVYRRNFDKEQFGECEKGQQRIRELEKDNEKKNKELQALRREVDDMRKRLGDETNAKEDAIRRLGELESSNPIIATLSDQNRPTKLAEHILELYDNEWTEAFDEMEKSGRTDQEIMKLLRDALMDIYTVCKRINDGYLQRVQKVVDQFGEICNRDLFQDQAQKTDEDDNLTEQFKHQIKDVRKRRARKHMEKIVQDILSKESLQYLKQPPFTGGVTQTYLRKCSQLCWLMCIQDPPMHLTTDTQEKFNLNVFREYTKRGPYVAYVIWPVLYLHLGGPILCKGVAQGTSDR